MINKYTPNKNCTCSSAGRVFDCRSKWRVFKSHRVLFFCTILIFKFFFSRKLIFFTAILFKNPKKMSKGVFVCLVVCSLAISLGLAIPTVYFGFAEENATCQHGTRAGLLLSDWVKAQGLEKICVTFVYSFLMLMTIVTERDGYALLSLVVKVCDILFTMIWWIIGVVVLATNENNSCMAEGNPLAIITVINLVFTWLTLGASSSSE